VQSLIRSHSGFSAHQDVLMRSALHFIPGAISSVREQKKYEMYLTSKFLSSWPACYATFIPEFSRSEAKTSSLVPSSSLEKWKKNLLVSSRHSFSATISTFPLHLSTPSPRSEQTSGAATSFAQRQAAISFHKILFSSRPFLSKSVVISEDDLVHLPVQPMGSI